MDRVTFEDAATYEPDEGWRRVAMAGSDALSLEYFEKPPGHASPMHDHGNEQVCVCLAGELTVATADRSVRLGPNDSVHLAGGERHRVENTGESRAVGLDVFAPGRSFDFWLDRGDDGEGEDDGDGARGDGDGA
jgi:quercetin dioxygenase-like cupin family protein